MWTAQAFSQAPVSQADRLRARDHFRAGVAEFEHGDFQSALTDFQAAYQLAPHYAVRANIANCYVQMHEPVEALANFEAYLAEAPSIPQEQLRPIERQMTELHSQIAEVHVVVTPDGTHTDSVMVDGHPTPIRGLVRLSAAGAHVIEANVSGYQPERAEVNVTAGARSDVTLRLRTVAVASNAAPAAGTTTTQPEAQPAPQQPTSGSQPAPAAQPTAPIKPDQTASNASSGQAPVDTSSHGLSPTLAVAGVGVTAVALIAWGVFGGLALSANSSFNAAVSNIRSDTDPN